MSRHSMRRPAALCFKWIAALLAMMFLPDARAAESHYRIAPADSWVTPAQADYEPAADSPGKPAGGDWTLVFDRQVNVTATGDDFYLHHAAKALDDAGVRDNSEVDIRLDPGFQAVDLHFIRVVRQGKPVDALSTARITDLPEETQVRERVYNGRHRINILLADVRVGDVVEYAYTLHTREILFPGRFATALMIGWTEPILWDRIRLRWPAQREIHLRISDGTATAEPVTLGGTREWVLQRKNVPAISHDGDAPNWYSPFPRLQASEFTDWGTVTRATSPYLALSASAGSQVAAIAREIQGEGGSPEQLALRALQYVQEQISYVSIAIGSGAFQAANPETTLERRYGDCKDKSVLLVALLRQLGIESHPALVHSYRGRMLPESLPSPFEFDHAIVRAQIGGKTYWLDGTANKQYAELSTDAPPDFEHALVLGAGGRELAAIPRPAPDSRRKSVLMAFNLTQGVQAPAKLRMVTTYTDGLADVMRGYYARVNPEQRDKDFLNYLVRYYPEAKRSDATDVHDDKERDVVVVQEHYAFPAAFTGKDGRLEFMVHADELYRFFEPLDSPIRRAPLALSYPVDIRQTIAVDLPDDWPVTPDKIRVENPAFIYESEVTYAARTLQVTYHYQSLKSEVDETELKQYLADRKRVYDDLGYSLSHNLNGASISEAGVAPMPLFALLISTALSAWAAVYLARRWDPEPAPFPEGAPEGLAGWLVLPTLGVIIGPFVGAYVVSAWLPFINASLWQGLDVAVNEGYRSSASLVIVTIGLLTGPLMVLHLLLVYLYFTKRTAAPRAFIIMIWFSTLYGLSVLVWTSLAGLADETPRGKVIAESVRECITTLIWMIYMLRSKRVKATFRKRAPQNVQTTVAVQRSSAISP